MPLNASERTQLAQAFLKCFGEDSQLCGRALRFMADFTTNSVNLLAAVQGAADTWQPFIDSGLTISAWKLEVERVYNLTQTNG